MVSGDSRCVAMYNTQEMSAKTASNGLRMCALHYECFESM